MRTLFFIALSGMALSCWAQPKKMPAKNMEQEIRDYGFYLKVGSGASFSNEAHISAPLGAWEPAVQGYDSGLGTVPIVLGGLGYDSPFAAAEVTASYRPNFKYRKFQTSPTDAPFDMLGMRTRRFNLDIASVLFSIYLNGRGFRYLHCNAGCGGVIYPIIGGGVGCSQLKLFNFRSTGLPIIVPDFPAFSSENQYAISYRFTYQVMAGLEYRYRDLCALSVGYRWFDISRFRGPRYFRSSEGTALDVGSDTWKLKFNANEAFVEFKVFL